MKSLLFFVALAMCSWSYFATLVSKKSIEKELKYEKTKCDSMYAELYPCQIELNRFHVAYEIFSTRNPKAASQFGEIISNETE